MTELRIFGDDVRPGDQFQLTAKPTVKARGTFAAITHHGVHVTRRLSDLFVYSDATPVLAHWHGVHTTDGFATTVGELRVKSVSQF